MMGSEKVYDLALKGDGITLSRKVDEAKAKAIFDIVLGDSPPLPAPDSSTRRPPGVAGNTRLSLREFLDEAGAKANPEKIAAIGQYMASHEGSPDFGRADVMSRFRTAKEAAPANPTRDFSAAIQNGWIAEDPQKAGRFYVTRKGHVAIDAKFTRRGAGKTAGRTKPSTAA